MARPPDYKRNKKRREDAQKDRKKGRQLRKAARKVAEAGHSPDDRANSDAVLQIVDDTENAK